MRLEDNCAERAIRPIAVGEKWLFCGSGYNVQSTTNLFSLVASYKLQGLDPESYLCDAMRVMPYFPRERYLELCPRNWQKTRSASTPISSLNRLSTSLSRRSPRKSSNLRASSVELAPRILRERYDSDKERWFVKRLPDRHQSGSWPLLATFSPSAPLKKKRHQ
jgi:hypothetical protein